MIDENTTPEELEELGDALGVATATLTEAWARGYYRLVGTPLETLNSTALQIVRGLGTDAPGATVIAELMHNFNDMVFKSWQLKIVNVEQIEALAIRSQRDWIDGYAAFFAMQKTFVASAMKKH